ncbi:MAG: class GN sortase [Desulforhopalus sp.]
MAAKILKSATALLILCGFYFIGTGLWIPAKAVLAQYLLKNAWYKSTTLQADVKPWPWADTWPVGRLRNDRLGVDLIILEGDSGEVLAFGPGHLSASSPPAGKGHCILAGHRDTSFTFMRDLVPGDLLTLEGWASRRVYRVVRTDIIEASQLYLDGDQAGMLTLITCYPFDAIIPGTPLRFVVTASVV